MSLVFSAIAPNSPLLIPSVGKDDLKYAKKTMEALEKLEENLYAARPQTIIVLSGHKKILNTSFAINLTPRYKSSFKNFGDFSESKEYFCDIGMCHHIREVMEGRIPVKLYSDEELDYEISVPLFHLTQNLKNFSIAPISFSALDNASHLNFGQHLKEIIFEDTKRIAAIASGDFSSRERKIDAGARLDMELIKNLKDKNSKKILRKNRDEIFGAEAENGYLSLLILLGIIEDTNYTPEILSYEFPFDVGLLVANFKLY
ncbi:AmmeMemoRadiSam system protein B [Candidatus Falkowbacteria bacterium RBG_13_39_14]|uniref:AmmeMemoRadiSam system protein B n=1 Tax=Candidatus Falkowbacteria bacterium RBG_13_39_14 TaxID=1797985 RepID=A0A1F5S3E8_9BACT|nr:MAG: AmmeMemoRadiSam system protein B [Candidatus Falkowbacteria bacterium RBG_13_39_14]